MILSRHMAGTVLLGIGLFLLALGIFCNFFVKHGHPEFIQTAGTVIESFGIYNGHETTRVRYTDVATNLSHESTVVFKFVGPTIKPPGESVTVYYDPKDPQNAISERMGPIIALYMVMVLGLILTGCGWYIRRAATQA